MNDIRFLSLKLNSSRSETNLSGMLDGFSGPIFPNLTGNPDNYLDAGDTMGTYSWTTEWYDAYATIKSWTQTDTRQVVVDKVGDTDIHVNMKGRV